MTSRWIKPMKHWSKLVADFGLGNGASQILGMLAGLIYVRFLPTEQYALYGLGLTTIAFIAVASDLGLNGSINYFWKRAREKGETFAPFFKAIRTARWFLYVPAAIIGSIAFWISASNSSDFQTIAIIILLVAITGIVALEFALYQAIFRMAQLFRLSYVADFAGQSIRVIAALSIWLFLPALAIFGLAGGLIAVLAALFTNWKLRPKLKSKMPVGPQPENPNRRLRGYLLPVFPSVLLFAVQDNAIYWIAAALGGASVMAETFALARIAVLFTIITGFVTYVVIPKLSNVTEDRKYHIAAWSMRGVFFVLGLAALAAAWLFPELYLFIIGPRYSHLSSELLIIIANASVMMINHASVLSNRLKGWVRWDPYLTIGQILIVSLLLLNWDYSTTMNVCMLFLTCSIVSFMNSHTVALVAFIKPLWVTIPDRDKA